MIKRHVFLYREREIETKEKKFFFFLYFQELLRVFPVCFFYHAKYTRAHVEICSLKYVFFWGKLKANIYEGFGGILIYKEIITRNMFQQLVANFLKF